MSDLRDVLQHRTISLGQSLRNADEFDAPAAKSVVKRKRRVRAALTSSVATVGAVAIGVGVWAGYGALNQSPVTSSTPSASASASASPSVTPSPSVTAAPVFEGRNPSMSDDEALARATHPATGEEWLATPHEAKPGKWANDDFFAGYWGPEPWYLVGHRAGNDILTQSMTGYIVEVDGDGTPRLIAAPRPDQSAVLDSDLDSPIAIASDVYYDSLAVPDSIVTPEGDSLDLRTGFAALRSDAENYAISTVAAVGPSALVAGFSDSPTRYEYWGAEVDQLLAGKVKDVTYFLRTPYGALEQLDLDPLAQPVEWTGDYGALGDGPFIDFFDQSCEGLSPGTTALTPDLGGDWVVAGHSGDREVLAPGTENDLAQAMYANWLDAKKQGSGGDAASEIHSLEEYVEAPAFVAVSTDDPDVWWLVLNATLSARYWC